MICPQCQKEGQTSRVTVGGTMSTAMYCPPFYDEEGKYHNHDMNRRTTSYRCSKGHTFEYEEPRTCWCGWKA